ncbi:MAG: S9 family peptidase, partial [Undibacterium sp.]|nr:S9 family peptidase [Undibacterium sp.]
NQFVFSKDDNLWLGTTNGKKIVQLTNNGSKDYSWGMSDTAWSPDGKRLFIKRSDVRQVHHLPVLNYSKANEAVEWNIYARTGDAIEKTELYILDPATKRQIKIQSPTLENHYAFPLGWRSDSTEVMFMRMTRDGKRLELFGANPSTGKCRLILTEEQKTFVGGLDFIMEKWAKQVTMLKDGKHFIWMSERDGWQHLYLYDMQGKLIRRLTEGTFPVIEVVKVDEPSNLVYFRANAEKNLYDTNLYSVNLDLSNQVNQDTGSKAINLKKLTVASGYHRIQFSPSGKYFLDTHSSVDRAPVVELRNTEGQLLQVVRKADISELQQIGWQAPEKFVVKAADGETDLVGILYKPLDFDPSKKYPVVEFIYAGPFTTVVPKGFTPNTSLAIKAQALAQTGYITYLIDGRGTTERSKAFQDVVVNHIGQYEILDRVAALQQLASTRPYMDKERIGIYGHSWGGYFAVRAMLMAPDTFKVGIASAPGELTEGAEINEPYMGLLSANKNGYDFGTNLNHATKLKGKLLFIHGTSDINAPFSTTVRMIDALIQAGKPYDLLLLPQRTHFFQEEDYVDAAIRRYFDENLKSKKM